MFKNLNSDFNKKDKFTCELSGCRVDGSPGVVERENGGGGPYEDESYYMNYVNH
jgi:hypothetical protein